MNATVSEIKSRLILSPTIQIKNTAFDITSDGQVFGVAHGQLVETYNVFTIKKLATYNCNINVQKIAFSYNSKFLVCLLHENDCTEVCIYDIKESKLMIHSKGNDNYSKMKYSTILWSPKSTYLLFTWNSNFQTDMISTNSWNTITLSGTKLDSLNRPLCSFSPDENYYLAVQRMLQACVIIYSTVDFIELKKYSFDDVKDLSGVSWLGNSSCFSLWDSPLQYNLQVWSVYGKQQTKYSAGLYEYGVKSVCHSPCDRLIAVMQLRKTEIVVYDTLTWRKVAILNHCERITRNKVVTLNKAEATTRSFDSSAMINWYRFDYSSSKLKTSRIQKSSHNVTTDVCKQRSMHFSCCGNYLATYEPTYPGCVWIWSLYGHNLLELVIRIKCKKKLSVADIKWHDYKSYLAVDMDIDTLIWDHETKSAFIVDSNEKTPLETVWCNSTNLFIAIATSESLSFAFNNLDS